MREAKRVARMQAASWLKRNHIDYQHLSEKGRLELFKTAENWCQDCFDFKPHAHLERLDKLTPKQQPMKVFIDSMWDWNSPGNESFWYDKIVSKMVECKQHEFLILSKNPAGYKMFAFPQDNIWLGTTVTSELDSHRIAELVNSTHTYGFGTNYLFISFEPLLGYVVIPNELESVDWIIIGGLSRAGKEPQQPDKEWVKDILDFADIHDTPVYMKDNLIWEEPRKEFPHRMKHTFKEK